MTEEDMCECLEKILSCRDRRATKKMVKILTAAMRETDWSPYQKFRNLLADYLENH